MNCTATTRTGAQCKNGALAGTQFCRIHTPNEESDADAPVDFPVDDPTRSPPDVPEKTPPGQRRRAYTTILIVMAMLYFAVGGILVWQQKFTVESYALAGGIVGSLASILGLVSLSRPALQQSDLANLDAQSLRSIATATEDLRALEHERGQELHRLQRAKKITRAEIEALNQQKEEMKLSVQKASLSLFLQNQRKECEKQALQELDNAKRLKELLAELGDIDHKLTVLEEEIESDPNVELLHSVMAAAQASASSPTAFDDFVSDLPPFTRTVFLVFREVGRALTTVITKPVK